MTNLNEKQRHIIAKAAAAVRDRGHEGDARLADSLHGILTSAVLTGSDERAPAAAPAPVAASDDIDKLRAFVKRCANGGMPTEHVKIVTDTIDAAEQCGYFAPPARAAAPTAQPTPCGFMGSSSMVRGHGTADMLRAAMEAAQPTLPEYIANLKGDVPAWKDHESVAAQPTLPDDERAAFEKWAKSKGHDVVSRLETGGKFYVSSFTRHAWDIWQARAALRQPGALPDEAEKGGAA